MHSLIETLHPHTHGRWGAWWGSIRAGLPSKWSEFPAVWVYFLHPDLIFVPAQGFFKKSLKGVVVVVREGGVGFDTPMNGGGNAYS